MLKERVRLVARDRQGSLEPLRIHEHERRFTAFDDDNILTMYERGMTMREIQAFLAEQYGTKVSPELPRFLPKPTVRQHQPQCIAHKRRAVSQQAIIAWR